ncbi:MAG: hypothetical protein HOP04_14435 [Methylophilaceae bacterium]|nr:hypothetical protein [Methylophilaceae bacterium]
MTEVTFIFSNSSRLKDIKSFSDDGLSAHAWPGIAINADKVKARIFNLQGNFLGWFIMSSLEMFFIALCSIAKASMHHSFIGAQGILE